MDLIAWSRVTFGNTRTRLDAKQGELTTLMEASYGLNVERIHVVKKEINKLLHHEEVFRRQQSWSIWLLAGHKNKKFFHQKASQKRRKNNIVGLYDRDGVWETDEDKIANIAEEYYKKLYTSSNSLDMEDVLNQWTEWCPREWHNPWLAHIWRKKWKLLFSRCTHPNHQAWWYVTFLFSKF